MRAPQTTPSRLTSAPYLLVAPLALVLVVFFGIPLLLVVVVSFFDLDKFDIIPTFVLTNYGELFGSSLTYALYAKTIKYALIVWAITLVIGFTVSYFLVFHVRNVLWQIALFLSLGESFSGANAGDFAVTGGTCGAVASPNSGCTIAVTFTPTAGGGAAEGASMAVNVSSDPTSPHNISLTGTGP